MTPIESIYEIKAAVLDLKKYLLSKDPVVSRKARLKYEQLVDLFFKGHANFIKPEQRSSCLNDFDYFMSLMEEAVEHYDFQV